MSTERRADEFGASDEAFSGVGPVVEPTAVIRPERTPAMGERSRVRVISGRVANAAGVARGWPRRVGYLMVVVCLAVTALTDDATSSHDRRRTAAGAAVVAAPPAPPRRVDPPAPSPPTTPAPATRRGASAVVRSTSAPVTRTRAMDSDASGDDLGGSSWRHRSRWARSSWPQPTGGHARWWGRGGRGYGSPYYSSYPGYQFYSGYGGYARYGGYAYGGYGYGGSRGHAAW